MTDSRELTTEVRQSDSLLAQIIVAAKDPGVDAAKMESMANLAIKLQDREREIEFYRSKNAAMQEMPVITKDGKIVIKDKDTGRERTQGRYARFEDIDRVVRPILQRHNLAISFDTGERNGGGITVRPILSHANGFTERGDAMPLPADQSGGKQPVQGVGSSVQYGKRYTMCAMLNIVTEGVDDDGRGGQAAVNLPFEREQLVLQEAEAAVQSGRYLEWFAEQSPKDRGWLVQSGNHERFGGQPLLADRTSAPGPAPREEGPPPKTDPAQEDPQPEPEPETSGEPRKRTPVQMVEDFEKRLDGCETSRSIIDLQAEPKVLQWMDQLERRYPELHKRVTDYAASRYAALVAKEREARSGGDKLI